MESFVIWDKEFLRSEEFKVLPLGETVRCGYFVYLNDQSWKMINDGKKIYLLLLPLKSFPSAPPVCTSLQCKLNVLLWDFFFSKSISFQYKYFKAPNRIILYQLESAAAKNFEKCTVHLVWSCSEMTTWQRDFRKLKSQRFIFLWNIALGASKWAEVGVGGVIWVKKKGPPPSSWHDANLIDWKNL